MRLLYFSFLIFVGRYINAAQVKWKPNTSFNRPLNFDDDKLPCGRQNVLFDEQLVSTVKIDDNNELEGLILPMNGELELEENATIKFGADSDSTEKCKAKDVHYIEKWNVNWLSADVWQSERFNDATPDAQRIPCFNDDVIFPEDSQFAVYLPDVVQHVQSVSLKGTKMDQNSFQQFVNNAPDRTQTFMLNKYLSMSVEIGWKSCPTRSGCPCQQNVTSVDCSLKSCKLPKCKQPIYPQGNCCPICGGVLEFDIDTRTFDYTSFKNTVENVVDDHGGSESIVYHVGLLWFNRVQVVMVDKREYNGNSALAAFRLSRALDGSLTPGFKQSLISGYPLNKVGVGPEIVGISLITVLIAFGGIYIWYQKPEFLSSIRLPHLPSNNGNMFSRFNNRENSITSFVSRGSIAFRSSFRNPLFTSKRQNAESTSGGEAESSMSSERAPQPQPQPAESGDLVQSAFGPVAMSNLSLIHDLE